MADDAFISFRYAINLSRGHGLVYNPGTWVLGTTTPLWTTFIAILATLGWPLEIFSIVLNICAATLSVLLFLKHCPSAKFSSSFSMTCMLCCVLFLPLIQMSTTSGMEAAVYFLFVLLAFDVALKRSWILAGILAAACFAFRPDGILVIAILSVWHMYERRRLPITLLLTFLALILPALYFEYAYYGALLPHSIVAKHLIHPGGILENARVILFRFTRNDLDIAIAAVGCVGITLLTRRRLQSLDKLLLVWLACYVIGLIFSGVDPIFYWYFYPISLLFVLLGAKGILLTLQEAADSKQVHRHSDKLFLGLLTALTIIYAISFHLRFTDRSANLEAYTRHAPALVAQVQSGESVYLCETGFLGYHLINNRIIDSSGINSPEMIEVIRREKETKPDDWFNWHVEAIREFKPDWVISIQSMCSTELLPTLDWFVERYELWEDNLPVQDELKMYRLRRSSIG